MFTILYRSHDCEEEIVQAECVTRIPQSPPVGAFEDGVRQHNVVVCDGGKNAVIYVPGSAEQPSVAEIFVMNSEGATVAKYLC